MTARASSEAKQYVAGRLKVREQPADRDRYHLDVWTGVVFQPISPAEGFTLDEIASLGAICALVAKRNGHPAHPA